MNNSYEFKEVKLLSTIIIFSLISLLIPFIIIKLNCDYLIDDNIFALFSNISMFIFLLFMFRVSKYKISFLFNNFKLKLKYFEVLNILITQFLISIGSFIIFISSICLLTSSNTPYIIKSNSYTHFQFITYFLLVVLTAPILEELLFRIILFKRIEFYFNTTISIILTSLIFGIFHTKLAIISAISFSVINCIIYLKYNNIFIPIFIHFLNNFFSVILELVVPLNLSISISKSMSFYWLCFGIILFICGLSLFIKYILQNKSYLSYKLNKSRKFNYND